LTPEEGNDFYVSLHAYNLGFLSAIDFTNTIGDDRIYAAIPTSDSGAVMVGYSSAGIGASAIAIVKIGPSFDYPTIQGVLISNPWLGNVNNDIDFNLSIYPNPATTVLNIKVEEGNVDLYKIMDLNGKELNSGPLTDNENQVLIDELSTGVYLLHMYKNENLLTVRRIVVQ
jgi:hypothetical protein